MHPGHIGDVMLRMGIQLLAPQPGTSKRAPGHKIYLHLLRKLPTTRANQVRALDTGPSRWPEGSCISPRWCPFATRCVSVECDTTWIFWLLNSQTQGWGTMSEDELAVRIELPSARTRMVTSFGVEGHSLTGTIPSSWPSTRP